MTEHNSLSGDDTILPFRLERSNLRGRVARIDRTLDRILEQHRYPAPVSALVADAVMLTALIGQAVKLRWKFSLQIRGDGPVRLIATDYFAPEETGRPARMRAYAGFDMGEVVSSRLEPFAMLGQGVFGVTIDQGPDMRPYQGVTPLTGGSLAACAETYFAQSEQIATRFHALAARSEMPGRAAQWRAGGLMLQQMPDAGGRIAERPGGEAGTVRKRQYLTIHGARTHNLQNVSASIPLGCFTCVTGVSGSGKSSLIIETLYRALAKRLMRAHSHPGPHERIDGVEFIDKVIDIDQ